MNTSIEEVIDLYLAKIENYDYLDYDEDELLEELRPMMNSAISKLFTIDVSIDWDTEEFSRELTPIEQNIIAYGLVEEFISQKVNSIKVLENHLAMKQGHNQMFNIGKPDWLGITKPRISSIKGGD